MRKNPSRLDWDDARQHLSAAQAMLEKALAPDAGQIAETYRLRAAQLAGRQEKGVESGLSIHVLVFSIGVDTYGLDISELAEVLAPTQCTRVPGASPEIEGVINYRGELRSVIDLRRLLGQASGEPDPKSGILMLRNRGEPVGLKVGRVEKVQKIRLDALSAMEAGGDGAHPFIAGMGPERIIVLNPQALLAHPVFNPAGLLERTQPQAAL